MKRPSSIGAAAKIPTPGLALGVRPATVQRTEADGRVTIACASSGPVTAALAVSGGYVPHVGDTVLVVTGDEGECYVLGVLASVAAERSLAAQDGASVVITGPAGAESLRIADAEGALLFEYLPAENRAVVHAPRGDLEFRAEAGSIAFSAADTVRVRGGRALDLHGDHHVRITTATAPGRAASSLSMGPRGMSVATPALDANAGRAEFNTGDAQVVARTLSTTAETLQQVVGVFGLQATRIIERAVNVYRDATELSQSTAGRLRMAAKSTLHMLGRDTVIEGEDGIKLQGDKIHLG